ncbi:MAG TPA: permease [Hyphomicrobiaceae bacterium]|nr:permease [Hyphomicrobiaceae bacterium]
MSATTATLSWFARHEARLAWRDWMMLMSGGRKRKDRAVVIGMAVFALGLHAIAGLVLRPYLPALGGVGVPLLAAIAMSLVLTFTMMFSQALEQVTRAFYTRDDLDLILSSPAPARHLFCVRISSIVITTTMMSGLIVAPFINVAAWLDGPRWLSAYAMIVAAAALSVGLAVQATIMMFRLIGPKKTRLVAQITAAVVGASFLIGIQTVAILAYGSMSRFALLSETSVLARLPDAASALWLPAHAVMGAPVPLLGALLIAALYVSWVVQRGSREFSTHAVAAMGLAETRRTHARVPARGFAHTSPFMALIQKEWTLLARDPWLVSQTLMQILYLIPPALMLWVSFGAKSNTATLLAPVLVMAAGQLAGALAWLAISGEDAPDLIATAPIKPRALIWAKIVSVLALIAAVIAPFVVAIALMSPRGALVIGVGAMAGAASAVLIQLWFRAQARRTNFRRRQVASRISTILEAFASILTAATAAVAAAGSWLALGPAALVGLVMLVAWLVRPRGD